MKKVLIISPNWPPVSYPDEHRVRIALPYFKENGWESLVIKIDPKEQEGIKDGLLCKTIPSDIRIWEAGFIPKSITRLFGIASIGIRSFFHIAALGNKIIKQEKPNVIFFSTVMFNVMVLGVYWKLRFKIPYVLDFIDPWYRGNDFPRHGKKGLRFMLTDFIAKCTEPIVIKKADHIISVSAGYNEVFLNRYKGLNNKSFTDLPYGAPENDFSLLKTLKIKQCVFEPNDGKRHWVYTGRGGEDLNFSLRAFFNALRKAKEKNEEITNNLIVHFIGTNYSPRNWSEKKIEDLAIDCGVGPMVKEHPSRITYFESLQCLLDAEALFVPGSDEPAYTASKIYPYILSQKPLLAVFHKDSSVVRVLKETHFGTVVSFDNQETVDVLSDKIFHEWFINPLSKQTEINRQAFKPYTASEVAKVICSIFNQL